MYPTVEVRWFLKGSLPDEVVSWYEDAVGLAHWHEGTDRYVRPAAPDGLNVKWREGSIEIKRLVETVGQVEWREVAGVAQRWRKWRFPLAEELPLAATGRDWVSVAKHSTTRTLWVKDGHLVLTKPGEQVPHGCHVAVANLKRGDGQWWTLALEGFGPDAEARESLRLAAERIFAESSTPDLPAESSMSYVRWLSGMA